MFLFNNDNLSYLPDGKKGIMTLQVKMEVGDA